MKNTDLEPRDMNYQLIDSIFNQDYIILIKSQFLVGGRLGLIKETIYLGIG